MIYKRLLKPLLFNLDAEDAHDITLQLASDVNNSTFLQQLTSLLFNKKYESLEREFWGLTFPNPIGLAAGFDKNAATPLAMQSLGFGFAEIGSITAKPSKGNPKPRAFRLPDDHSLINRMGLNNKGAEAICRTVSSYNLDIPLGVNIAKTNDASIYGDDALRDYLFSYEQALAVADYITVNISCPNTGEGKTFEDPSALNDLLSALEPNRKDRKPTLVKFSVDTPREVLQTLVNICEDHEVSGYVATNTSSNRSSLKTNKARLAEIGNGGLSGNAIFEQSTQVVQWLSEILGGSKPIVGVGGINDSQSALRKLEAGADLIQLYTGLVYEGPGLISRIKKGLDHHL
ncbi:MAG: quinone-dependent dihydroorotate dehydrogenase [Balneolaceae bacterium]|nr:quinone-dependent dihydroorotate dehydrogenase [Balneolaceae bacterium]